MKKLFAADYDGTLFANLEITNQDLEAIQQFKKAGHLFGICSGRHLDSLIEETKKYQIPYDFLIGNNGAAIMDHQHCLLRMNRIDSQYVFEVKKYCDEVLYDQIHFLGINNGFTFGRQHYILGSTFAPEMTATYESFDPEQVCALFIEVVDEKETQRLRDQLQQAIPQLHFYANNPYIDVSQEDIDKANGISFVAQHFNIEDKCIRVIGDSYNDISMIEHFNGYVMNNAIDFVKKTSDKRVDSVSEALLDFIKI